MPIVPTTNALPNSSPASNPTILLGPDSTDIRSAKFSVGTEPCYIQAYGLGPGESIRIEMTSGTKTANFSPLGKEMKINPNQPTLRLDWPGIYDVVYTGSDLNSILCIMYYGTTTHNTIYGISANNGGDTNFVTVIGDDPIEVTGNGSASDPYHVGILDLNYNDGSINLGFGAGDPSTGGLNVNIGRVAGNNSGANNSVVIGVNAGANVADGSNKNVSIGYGAGDDLNGDNNVIIGTTAGDTAVGDNNILLGEGAGSSAPVSAANIFIGKQSGVQNEATNTVGIGNTAGQFSPVTNGVFIGTNAGTSAQGDATVYIGLNAGLSSAAPDNTIAIGTNAGHINIKRGIFIGGLAGEGNTAEDVIIIDESASGMTATADHYCMLGSATITHTVTAGSVISGGAISASDARLKVNIKELPNAREIVNTMRPVVFSWDAEKLRDAGIPHLEKDLDYTHAGLIAQEVEELVPEAVQGVFGRDGEEYKFIHYDRLVPYLISVIQHLDERISLMEKK